ncbi:hypothetical protein [Leeuwenhoekiella sp. W20_SRS_FM14]|uniref:hypothetical protein n=1 Tax=Leeuwenhoekiella sp. W20_SRS_FM14 TaxID=3240270 RepID=UPI003F9D3958
MKKILLTLVAVAALVSCKTETKTEVSENTTETQAIQEERTPEQEVAYKIAEASGLENWDKVSELQFTFNVDRGDSHFARAWKWNPKTDDVTMMSPEDTINYNRKSVDSLAMNADKGFINDAYWLLAPIHLVWDNEGTNLTVQDTATAPMSKQLLKKITITYGDEGGYTPGDAYDFFYDDTFMVREWIYRRGNVSEFSMVTTWDDYNDYKGLKIASDHKAPEDAVHLYFTDIAVKTEE